VAPTATPALAAGGAQEKNETDTATLVAAVIAAAAALLSVLTTTVVSRRSEGREVQRSLLKDHLAKLGDAIHEVVATSSTQHKKLREARDRRLTLEAARVDSTAAQAVSRDAPSPQAEKGSSYRA
jgi:uncharacterized protein YicC (UPF0701 family)